MSEETRYTDPATAGTMAVRRDAERDELTLDEAERLGYDRTRRDEVRPCPTREEITRDFRDRCRSLARRLDDLAANFDDDVMDYVTDDGQFFVEWDGDSVVMNRFFE